MTNICSICNERPVRKSGKRYQSYCVECNKSYQITNYNNNKSQFQKNAKNRKIDLKVFVDEEKKGKPCKDCGLSYPPYVMDYDHRDPTQKRYSVSYMRSNKFSVENIQKEIDKCDLVCANCHRIRTHSKDN